jgi:hypothetical protein
MAQPADRNINPSRDPSFSRSIFNFYLAAEAEQPFSFPDSSAWDESKRRLCASQKSADYVYYIICMERKEVIT